MLHRFASHDIADEIAATVADELDASGVLHGAHEFESVMTGIVRSATAGALPAWKAFYENSIRCLEDGSALFAPVHRHAASLLIGDSVLDLGSCFGFFPLRLAALGHNVIASDLSAAAMRLLETVSPTIGRPIRTMTCDATAVSAPSSSVDTVTALHLVEHLNSTATIAALDEAIRVARSRVIVAVPFEKFARECYGHVQAFHLDALTDLGHSVAQRHLGIRASVHEYHGGWLVLDL
ncbi:class I SAM-dependent methyltransferase [Antrihabitans cavernicola]|uniref:Class I SAM-dependent methyltransferase n=1 Tax=Antrihabitans cavernicola TaxID=2495913 RepID=A0A5A7S7E4_9NOCA|nr:class I SAM-dependent methyltransferase [Spelaeibacter cavernicola]